uniref:Lipid droplet-associated hydrolase n=1 Tax=Oncorhynchus tshawytscha TaxID=74940 RepID=A0A8C8M514_ONCTS
MKIGNPGVIGFYMTFMQTLHQTLGWCSPVWAVTHAGHWGWTEKGLDGTKAKKVNLKHKLVFLSEHIPRDTYLVLMGHSVSCYIILEMLTLDPELQVVKSVMLFPTIERMAVTPQGRLLTPVLCHLHLCSLPARLPPLSTMKNSPRPLFLIHQTLQLALYFGAGSVFLASAKPRFVCQMVKRDSSFQRTHFHCSRLWMFCHSYVQLVFYYGACDHWYHVQYHQETKRDFPNGDIRLCSRGIRHALVLDTGKEVADMIVEWIHGNLQTWS